MIWWFLILGISAFVVVCAAIGVYMRLRRHWLAVHAAQDAIPSDVQQERQPGNLEG